ncbi:MAG: hypothetical protein WC619_04110 [Patescibacteria group bacterium]
MNATDTATIEKFFQNVAAGQCVAECQVEVLQARLIRAMEAKSPIREIESLIYRLGNRITPMFPTELVGTHIHEINIGEDWRKAPEWEAARFLMKMGSLNVLTRFDAKANKAGIGDVANKAHSVIIQKVVPSISAMFLHDRAFHVDCNHPLLFDLMEWMSREENQSGGPSDLKRIDAFFKELVNCLFFNGEFPCRFPYFGLEIRQVAEESSREPAEVEKEFLGNLAKAFAIYLGKFEAAKVVNRIIEAVFVEMLPYLAEEMWSDGSEDGGEVLRSAKDCLSDPGKLQFHPGSIFMKCFAEDTKFSPQLWYLFCFLWEEKAGRRVS